MGWNINVSRVFLYLFTGVTHFFLLLLLLNLAKKKKKDGLQSNENNCTKVDKKIQNML